MNEHEGPTWETAKGFTAQSGPLWIRQLVGGVLAAPFVAAGLTLLGAAIYILARGGRQEKLLQALAISGGGWLIGALVIRFHIALGWRVVDEMDVDFTTKALSLGQRRLRGRSQRRVETPDLASVREVSLGSYRGEPMDWFEFKLTSGEKIRFSPPSELLAISRPDERSSAWGSSMIAGEHPYP